MTSGVERGGDSVGFERITPDGESERVERVLAAEVPLALEFNGIGYAVLMASPSDIEDLVIGFAHAERLITRRDDVVGLDVYQAEYGLVVRIQLVEECAARVLDRVRHHVASGACGLCGIETLEQAMRPLPLMKQQSLAEKAALFRALEELDRAQPRNRATGAMHGAALCSADGSLRLVREDVGRHNAFDKLIGAMMDAELDWDGGFALLSSRCSFELVEKAALAGCPLLVTISAPTDLAVRRASAAGLGLIVLARKDAILRLPPVSPL
jgi:FdhD protein